MPSWRQRIVDALKAKGVSKEGIEDVLASARKHGRQRTRAKPKRVRRTKPKSKHKKKGKKPVRKKPIRANRPRYRRKK